MPAESDTSGPIIVSRADPDVALVHDRRRWEADDAPPPERAESSAAPRVGPDRRPRRRRLPRAEDQIAERPLRSSPPVARRERLRHGSGRSNTARTLARADAARPRYYRASVPASSRARRRPVRHRLAGRRRRAARRSPPTHRPRLADRDDGGARARWRGRRRRRARRRARAHARPTPSTPATSSTASTPCA